MAPLVASVQPPSRIVAGWIVLAILFGFMIPATIAESYTGTDVRSRDPVTQAGNLEAAVRQEAKSDPQRKEIEAVIAAVGPKHLSDEDAAAVYAGAAMELHRRLSSDDLRLLARSPVPARRIVAELYSYPPPGPSLTRNLVDKLPKTRFLYQLARAQALERIGDRSARRDLSPDLDEKAALPKAIALYAALSLAMLVGAGALCMYVFGLASGTIKWAGHPVEPPSLLHADLLAVRAAQLFGVMLLADLVVQSAAASIRGAGTATGELVTGIVASALVIIGTVWVTRTRLGSGTLRLSAYGISWDRVWPSFLWGLGGAFAVVPLATVGAFVGSLFVKVAPRPDHPLLHLLEDPHNVAFVIGALFLAAVQAPFTEELLFRGTLTPALSGLLKGRRYATPIAILVSSTLFASIHPQGLSLWFVLASVGVVNCVLCYQTRSVLPGMFMHAIYNGSVLAMTLIIR